MILLHLKPCATSWADGRNRKEPDWTETDVMEKEDSLPLTETLRA